MEGLPRGKSLRVAAVDMVEPGSASGGPPPLGDVELVARVATGDAAAYRELMGRHLRGVTAFANRLLGNRADAEDVCQETFARLWGKADSFRPQAKVSTWLYRIAHNLCIDRLRRRRWSSSAEVEALPAAGRPSQHLGQKQLAESVQAALLELPARQRSAVTLSHYQGMSHVEIGSVLGVSVRAVESLLARGRRHLRKSLAEVARPDGLGAEV